MAGIRAAVGRIISAMLGNWLVLAAATPNVASWVVPQDGFITGVNIIVDVKTAITVLAVMVEKNGVNILAGAGADMNAAAVRTPTAGVLTGTTSDGYVAVSRGDVITVDVDTLTGTSCQGVQAQIDFLAK
jgi:hypothetical protein